MDPNELPTIDEWMARTADDWPALLTALDFLFAASSHLNDAMIDVHTGVMGDALGVAPSVVMMMVDELDNLWVRDGDAAVAPVRCLSVRSIDDSATLLSLFVAPFAQVD